MNTVESQEFRSKLGDLPAEWNAISERIIGAAIEVHRHPGPGLPERHYEEALEHELRLRGLGVERQVSKRIRYKDLELSECRLDLVVEDVIVIELKAVEALSELWRAQLVSYLHVFEMPIGLLINFHSVRLIDGVTRRVNSKAIAPAQQRLGSRASSANSAVSAPPRSI